jgi:hypothetical protein
VSQTSRVGVLWSMSIATYPCRIHDGANGQEWAAFQETIQRSLGSPQFNHNCVAA